MEYQVLEDGEWVTRNVDIYQVMARNQQHADTEMREPESKPRNDVPEVGILSKTVIPSPSFKFILPANLRHQNLNDVVLVGETSIHLKEIRDYGHLHHIATKSDFNGRILAARVYGSPRVVQANKSGQELPFDRAAIHRGRRSHSGDIDSAVLPPEVVVLTLSSRTLMFLWARQSSTGIIKFAQMKVRLPAATSRFDRLGTFLAVDPKCRAIAVAAHEGHFILYKTKSIDQWRKDENGALPIKDERHILIQGRIMHMEFLSSSTSQDDFHVVLVFVLIHGGKTKITCFDWDSRTDLSTATARTERASVVPEDSNPSLLIPLSRSTDFILIYGDHVSTYKNVLSGHPSHAPTSIKANILPPLRPGDNKTAPQWVQWDRAPRNPDFPKEAFYVAREDGMVMYLERGAADAVDTNDAGKSEYPIDTAFACVNVDNSEFSQLYPDVLIAGGSASDGHLLKVGAWPQEYSYVTYPGDNTFDFVESIPNWTPLTDLSVTRLPGLKLPYERERPSIFIANGRAPHGEISELRRGLHALIDDSFAGMTGCTGLWVIDYGNAKVNVDGREVRQHYATFIITLPPESMLIRVSRTQVDSGGTQGEFWSAWDPGVWDKIELPSIDEPQDDALRVETITACSWTDQFAIQITHNEARVLRRPTLTLVDSLVFPNSLLLAATRMGFAFSVIAFRENGQTYLELIRLQANGAFSKGSQNQIRHQLENDPTCIELLDLDGIPHVFVGTSDSRITLYKINETGPLILVYSEQLEQNLSGSLRMLCESAVLLVSRGQKMLVCGTRNGFLLSLSIQMTGSNAQISKNHLANIGATAAKITPSATDPSTAFVACGSDFCRVRFSHINMSKLDIDSIWFTDYSRPSYLQCPITAIDQLPFVGESENIGRNLGGFIFAVSGDRVVFAQLDHDIRWSSLNVPPQTLEDNKVVPRKLPTGSTPTKLVYMEWLKKLVVATQETREERAPPDGYRVTHSAIKLLNLSDDRPPSEPEIKQEDNHNLSPQEKILANEFPLKHSERVYSIVEWTFVGDRGHKHHFIIAGTGITEGFGKETGRRLFLQLLKTGIKQMKQSVYAHPVRCMAVYDSMRIVMSIGNTLSLDEYEPESSMWIKRGIYELTSAGVHLTVSPPFVYVSTLKDSHMCFEIVLPAEPRQGQVEFKQVFTDARERPSTHHLTLSVEGPVKQTTAESSVATQALTSKSSSTVVLVTDKNCSVTGLFQPPSQTYKSAAPTIFEACLPRAIVRIQRGDIRPPWRRPIKSHTTPFAGVAGVLVDDIIGACSDGTVYNLTILSAPTLKLLRLIQKLIEQKQNRDPRHQFSAISQSSGEIYNLLRNSAGGSQDGIIRARDVNPAYEEIGAAAPRARYIDGDLLSQFFDEGGDLWELVYEGTAKDVPALFQELTSGVPDFENLRISEEETIQWVRNWVSDVLMPVL